MDSGALIVGTEPRLWLAGQDDLLRVKGHVVSAVCAQQPLPPAFSVYFTKAGRCRVGLCCATHRPLLCCPRWRGRAPCPHFGEPISVPLASYAPPRTPPKGHLFTIFLFFHHLFAHKYQIRRSVTEIIFCKP